MTSEFESQIMHDAIGKCSQEYEPDRDVFTCAVQRLKGVALVENVPTNVPRRKLDTLSRDAVEELKEKVEFDL